MTTKTDITQERADFEAAYAATFPTAAGRPDKFDQEAWGEYRDAYVVVGWRMWQAGRAAVEADRQGRMPSDDDVATACKSLGWDLDAQEEADMILLVRTVMSRYGNGQPARTPCDAGEICIDCQPRRPDGSCPDGPAASPEGSPADSIGFCSFDPADRFYHAKDRTWWRRDDDGMLVRAEAPAASAEPHGVIVCDKRIPNAMETFVPQRFFREAEWPDADYSKVVVYAAPVAQEPELSGMEKAFSSDAIARREERQGLVPTGSMTDEMRDAIEGMSVSVDVSTGDHDAGHRYFGTVTEVMDHAGDKHGVTLLVQDAEPNFDAPVAQDPVSITERWQDGDDSNMVSRVVDTTAPVAAQAQLNAPDGWKLVPVEPTDEMIAATYTDRASKQTRRHDAGFRAGVIRKAIAASPTPPSAQVDESANLQGLAHRIDDDDLDRVATILNRHEAEEIGLWGVVEEIMDAFGARFYPSAQDREDAERMEWICDHATTRGGGAGMDVTFRVPDSEDIRDAIDAARAAKGDHHG